MTRHFYKLAFITFCEVAIEFLAEHEDTKTACKLLRDEQLKARMS